MLHPIGTVKGDAEKGFSLLTVKPRFLRALEGLEKFREIMIIYLQGDKLRVHRALLKKLEGNELYLNYSGEIEGKTVVDIKPYFRELDE